MPGQRRDGAAGAQVIVISGPSGVGKDTIINELRRRPIGQTFHYVVTCTTREPRSGEMNGVHYHFHTDESFTALRGANGYRAFRESDLHKLAFLGRARSLGFSIEECRTLMALYEDKHRASADVKALAE